MPNYVVIFPRLGPWHRWSQLGRIPGSCVHVLQDPVQVLNVMAGALEDICYDCPMQS
ncbi:hypothetical protein K438DRAFT_1864609 [Mycena galopus ATCC 62051]|nr:hypothetical protein K438DRAFT_1864609 [Mycena galopus ATCC 62051]